MAVPHIGSVVAKTLGPKNPTVPPFISIGQNMEIGGETASIKAFHTAGFLGTEYAPFLITDPQDAASAVRPPADLGSRFQSRRRLYEQLLAHQPVYQYGGDFQRESLIRSMDAADRLLTSPSAKAFDLSLEPRKNFDVYNTSRCFGQGCLLARRLVEAGARYVEVTTEYIPFRYWELHQDGHERQAMMKKMIDAPVAQLILDLEDRGLLNRTLVVLASEFSRDAITEGKVGKEVRDQSTTPDVMTQPMHYGMHRHFTAAGSVLMFGGGVKRGFVYGKTADERPCTTIENPVPVEDLHATMYYALGISPTTNFVVEKRPVYVTRDGKGQGDQRAILVRKGGRLKIHHLPQSVVIDPELPSAHAVVFMAVFTVGKARGSSTRYRITFRYRPFFACRNASRTIARSALTNCTARSVP